MKLDLEPRVEAGPSFMFSLKEILRKVALIVNGLVDSKANINSPALTGTPTAPTPPSTDNSTRIATTAWAKLGFAVSLNATFGYIKFPTWMGGLVVQWDNVTMSGSGGLAAVLPMTFPTAGVGALVTVKAAGFFVAIPAYQLSTTTMTTFICNSSGTGIASAQAFYLAWGH